MKKNEKKERKKKKGVVQPDVDLEVDSPAHSFLRLVTPGKLHSPTAGTARFGKITRRGKPSAHMIRKHTSGKFEQRNLFNKFITTIRLFNKFITTIRLITTHR